MRPTISVELDDRWSPMNQLPSLECASRSGLLLNSNSKCKELRWYHLWEVKMSFGELFSLLSLIEILASVSSPKGLLQGELSIYKVSASIDPPPQSMPYLAITILLTYISLICFHSIPVTTEHRRRASGKILPIRDPSPLLYVQGCWSDWLNRVSRLSCSRNDRSNAKASADQYIPDCQSQRSHPQRWPFDNDEVANKGCFHEALDLTILLMLPLERRYLTF